jgi:hypothetical protein
MLIDKEEMLLRELAAGRCVIPKVTAELGPMSLWSKEGLEREIRKAIEAEREACAEICDAEQKKNEDKGQWMWEAKKCGIAIRARGEA